MLADRDSFTRASRVLVVAMFGVVSSFLASAFYSHDRLSSAVEALSIATNAAPSIRYLADARTHLHRLAFQAGANLDNERRLFTDDLSAYYKLPVYPGERELQVAFRPSVEALYAGLDRFARDPGSGPAVVIAEVEALDDKLNDLIELDANHLEAEATAIQQKERRYDQLVYLLYGTSVLIAALATLLVIRAVGRYFWVLDRRARELEYFAVQVGHDILNPLTAVLAGLRIARDQATEDSMRQSLDRGLRGVGRIEQQISSLRSIAASGEERSPPGSRASLRACLDGAAAIVEPGEDAFVECTDGVLQRIVGAMLADAAARSGSDAVSVRVIASSEKAGLEVEGGAALARGVDPFSPRIRGPDSGYPGIELGMLSARRLVEAHGGTVGNRSVSGRCVTFVELPRA